MENRQRLIAAAQLLLLLAVTTAAAAAAHRPPRYRTAAARDPAKLNVHIVCHSHDDSGWLKTVDQYYWGANNTIQVAGVQYILDTVVQALAANPDRKFIYSEMSFFERWWGQQDEDTRALVTRLVQDGQLEFVNGGYVQHDEATAHYVAMIDQTTRGHRWAGRCYASQALFGFKSGRNSCQCQALLTVHMAHQACLQA
jgi:alpha-mannosidase